MIYLFLFLLVIFLILGLVHLNWVFGGKWAFENALPTAENGNRIINPGKTESAVVGLGLIAFGFFYLLRSGLIAVGLPEGIFKVVGWLIPAIFILRAIGDFKYIGFFKKIRSTTFGKLDSKFYSPLCLMIGLLGILLNFGFAPKIYELDLKSQFNKYGVNGCFVLYDQAKNEYILYDKAHCDSGYIPASTFKIPHSLIVLEEGLIQDTNQIITWDGHEWPVKNWNQNQTLKTAIRYSCVWAYVGFAGQLGIDTYHEYVNSFDYGNKNLMGPPLRFWLTGSLRISAFQQIDFLRKMYNYELKVSEKTIDIVKSCIVLEKTDAYTLSGKTGGGMLNDSEYIMWLVGYIETGNNTYFYAMNFVTDDFNKLSQARFDITRDILKELKIIGN